MGIKAIKKVASATFFYGAEQGTRERISLGCF
ncbi:Uncharacterised protein [Serratia plymuthica]|nr:Uncharacterised protein [Serratia plymuthica]VEI20413.1 Uncharacterised protein [Serratia plymuthica]